MILVVGATGVLGGEIARRLLAVGQPVRAFVRSSSGKAGPLSDAGAEVAFGDLLNRKSVADACQGIEAVVSTASAMSSQNPGDSLEAVDRDGQCALVDAAEAAGVRRFVYVSSPEQPEQSPLQAAKQAVESRLRSGRMPFTVLRPSFLTEVWLSPALGFDHVEGRVRVYGSGQNPISWISITDVARAATWALTGEGAEGSTLELGGSAAVSPESVVAAFERISGRRFACESVPEQVLREQYASALDPRQKTFFAVALQYARGHQVDLERLPAQAPRPQTDIESYARHVLGRAN
jgi:uncharacterized protein YbjT (DUF2867 family)